MDNPLKIFTIRLDARHEKHLPFRHRPHRRFRQPGHAVDRQARARSRRLFGDRSLSSPPRLPFRTDRDRRRLSCQAARIRRSTSAVRGRRRRSSMRAFRCSASATASRPCAPSSAAGWRAAATASSAAPFWRSKKRATSLRRRVGKGHAPSGMDEPRRSSVHRHSRQAFSVIGTSPGAPFATIAEARRGSSMPCSFTPKWCTRRTARSWLQNFWYRIAGIEGDWTMRAYHPACGRGNPRNRLVTDRVICGLSGGVNSSVAAVLIHEAIGEQLTCIFVDHGLMRKNEAREVVEMFAGTTTSRWCTSNALRPSSARWRARSTRKRNARLSGRLFIEVFERRGQERLGQAPEFLAQGTLYPDVIESVSFTAAPRSPSSRTTMSAACPSA